MPTFILEGASPGAARRIDYARELNQEQLDVVLHGDGACLVLAGAGSGKTRTITYRVAYLLEQGIDPSSLLLMTFTNKAAREMLDRVSLLLGVEARGIWSGTFHSIANRLLRVYASELGYRSGFSILDQEDARGLIKAVMKELRIDSKAQRFPSPAVVHDLVSFAQNTMSSLQDALEMKHPHFAVFESELQDIQRMYIERKRAANAMDFDDLLLKMLELSLHPQIGPVLGQRFQHILVDEYQDINALQAGIVQQFAQVNRNVLVVGDDAQSIYAFRGADVKNILSFPREWPDTKIYKLLTNYRSVPEILDLANASLTHNEGQFEKALIGVRDHGQKPLVVPTASARQEAQYIAEQILKLRADGIPLVNIAVLFRSSAHSQALEFELVKRDVPYDYRGGMKFFGRAHIKDVLAHVRILSNPSDETAWMRVLGQQPGIGITTATTLARRCAAFTTFEDVMNNQDVHLPARAAAGWATLERTLRDANDAGPGPAHVLRRVVSSSYADYLEREYPDYRDRLEDLEQLMLFAENYQDLAAFLGDIALYDEAIASQDRSAVPETERIVLSTIHQAKGLEWDTVFIMHLAEDSFPSRYATGQDAIEEERRLFYVAVTRARHRLFLTYPVTSGRDDFSFNRPSLFLDELSPHLTERLEVRSSGFRAASQRDRSHTDDQPWEDDVISIDRHGERSTPSQTPGTTMWKSSPKQNPPALPTSFFRDI